MSENLRTTFAEKHGSSLAVSAYHFDPRTIRPETLSGVCTAVGQVLSCLGLASIEKPRTEQPDYGNLALA